MPDNATPSEVTGFGKRVHHYRKRNGLTRAVLGGLVGRSAEWVKAIETGRLQVPRLPLLLRLAEVLQVKDLADLTGEQRLSAMTVTREAHEKLPVIRTALTTYHLTTEDVEPLTPREIADKVRHGWQLWHGNRNHRTQVAEVLPNLLTDLKRTVRQTEGNERRRALSGLAQVYHLAQLYLSFQPAQELVTLTGDRAMAAAQDADDPHAMAVAAWYMNHVFRDAGERHEARVELAMSAARLVKPERGPEDLARWGLLQLAAALSYAKVGKAGEAWRYWDRADEAARRLGDRYAHPYLIFGQGMVDAYAITMNADLLKGGSAVRAATKIDLASMPSATRRSFHMIESARAHDLQNEDVAVVHLLAKAYEESPETAKFNRFTRSAVIRLGESKNGMIRDDVHRLARKVGVQVA